VELAKPGSLAPGVPVEAVVLKREGYLETQPVQHPGILAGKPSTLPAP
jgi:hypothetical protein